jgi:hypothetical protein
MAAMHDPQPMSKTVAGAGSHFSNLAITFGIIKE